MSIIDILSGKKGQLTAYVSAMVGIEGFVMALEFLPFESTVSYQYQAVAILGGLVFLNTMACRVFRLLRLDKIDTPADAYSSSIPMSVMQFREIRTRTTPATYFHEQSNM